MPRRLDIHISDSVWQALEQRRRETGESLAEIVESTLCEAFELDKHSLFQVSTSGALVQGVFSGVLTVKELARHGDFGLGTFAGLDGELIVIDGECFRATADGVVDRAADDRLVPFALVTNFVPDVETELGPIADIGSLQSQLDALRPSENQFVGIRAQGSFDRLHMRAACPARGSEGLLEATEHQSEFEARDVVGTLVGFWAPTYATAVSVPGYHFHFISEDRSLGGHLLELQTGMLDVGLQVESDVHLAIPETEEFLTANLSGEQGDALRKAETVSRLDR